MFVGREQELADLERQLRLVREGGRLGRGAAVAIRGRRRVGKSALAAEFIKRSGLPSVYFQAARGAPIAQELASLIEAIKASDMPEAERVQGLTTDSFSSALRVLADALPDDGPSIVVLDELPWLLESVPGGAGELQRAWDQHLSSKPVLLMLLGSDLSMMEALDRHDQPFYGRSTPMTLRELSVRDVATLIGQTGFDAFDAHLVTGGQPLLLSEWTSGMSTRDFVEASLSTPTSALVTSGTRLLDGEFPDVSLARPILRAIGGRGERAFTHIRSAAGISQVALERGLSLLIEKRVIAVDEPLSTARAAKDRRWRIADPALRFWLTFVEPALDEVDRRRGDLAFGRWSRGFAAWRGRAIEPVVREALVSIASREGFPGLDRIGGWWPRSNNPEIDLVGADAAPANKIAFVGTIKWRPDTPITADEVGMLARGALHVPGVDAGTPLVAVCPAGSNGDSRLQQVWTAEDLI